MEKPIDFIKHSIGKIWEGFLNHLGVYLLLFLVSCSYLVVVAINKIKEFQLWVRAIPTDYVLTPAVLLIVVAIVLVYRNKKLQQRLSQLETKPQKNEKQTEFVTHLGVWWKLYPETEYIEDFPYCSCCETRTKLVQVEWNPDEKYKCPKTNAEYKLYDTIPRRRDDVLEGLYSAHFHSLGSQFQKRYFGELRKIRELNPGMSNRKISEGLFQLEPLRRIPLPEIKKILDKNDHPENAFHFVERNFITFKKYFKKKNENSNP